MLHPEEPVEFVFHDIDTGWQLGGENAITACQPLVDPNQQGHMRNNEGVEPHSSVTTGESFLFPPSRKTLQDRDRQKKQDEPSEDIMQVYEPGSHSE
jgi:hypothetical protein